MSVLDDFGKQSEQLCEKHIQMMAEQAFWKELIHQDGVICVELEETFDLAAKLAQAWGIYHKEQYPPFVTDIIEYANEEDRKVYGGSCKHVFKNDTIGFLEKLSEQPITPKPIVIINDITEIPSGESV